jgi:hypothetical protein
MVPGTVQTVVADGAVRCTMYCDGARPTGALQEIVMLDVLFAVAAGAVGLPSA